MTDMHNDGAQRFGAQEQQRLADAQRQANAGGEKCDIIVVLSPTSKSDDVSMLDLEGNLQSYNFTGVKSHDRLVQLLSHVVGPELRKPGSAYDILLPQNGVPAEISAHESFDNNYSSRIVRYSVNLTVNEMRSLLSHALFNVVGDRDLNDVVASAGIFALYLIENKQAVNVIRELESQFDGLRKQQAYVSVSELSDDELEKPLIDFRKLPGTNNFVLVEGVKRAFVVQNIQGQLVTFSNSVSGEQTVASQDKQVIGAVDLDDESEQFDGETEISGREWLGYDAAEVTIDQKSEALTAIGYDLTDWEEEGIADAFLAEQEKYLEENSDDDAEDEDGEEDEGEDLDEEEEDGEEAEAEFNAVDTMADLLDETTYDRSELKRVLIILGGKCLTSDTKETLTAKILDNIAERELDEADFVELLDSTVCAGLAQRNADAVVFLSWLDGSSEEGTDEEEEELDEEEDADEDEDADNSDDGDDDADDAAADDQAELSFEDPLDAFDHDGAALEHGQRVAALEALGVSTDGLNAIQVMKLFRAQQAANNLNTHEGDEDDFESDDFEDDKSPTAVILSTADLDDLVIILDLIGVEYEPDATQAELIELILNSGAEQSHIDGLVTAAETYGMYEQQIEDLTYEDLLAAFIALYFSPDASDVDDEEEEEAELESLGEQIIQAAGKANVESGANPLGLSIDSDNSDSQKFLIESEKSMAGQLMSVDMPQSLLINFTLTDRSTFEDSKELSDINGVNYRFPFNNPKSEDKARGSMYQPASTMIEIMETAATSRFLVDRSQFDVEQFSNSLNDHFASELESSLYVGLIEDGEDPRQVGVKTGDFVDDEMLDDSDIDPEYWSNFAGDDMPVYSFVNGHVGVRPVTLEERNSVLCLGVLNIALPGVWSANGKNLNKMLLAAVNAVKSMLADNTKINVYVGFTLSSGSLIVDNTLSEVVDHLRSTHDELFTYSSADCALFADNEDVLEIASSLDNLERLPLEVLSSGFADKTFENGGDLTILIPLFESDDADEEDEGDDE